MKYFFIILFILISYTGSSCTVNKQSTSTIADSGFVKQNWLLNFNIQKVEANLGEKYTNFPRPLSFTISTDLRLLRRIYQSFYFYPMLTYMNKSDYLKVYDSHYDRNLLATGIGLFYNYDNKKKSSSVGLGFNINRYNFWSYIRDGNVIYKNLSKSYFQRFELISSHKIRHKSKLQLGLGISHLAKGNVFIPHEYNLNLFMGIVYGLN